MVPMNRNSATRTTNVAVVESLYWPTMTTQNAS